MRGWSGILCPHLPSQAARALAACSIFRNHRVCAVRELAVCAPHSFVLEARRRGTLPSATRRLPTRPASHNLNAAPSPSKSLRNAVTEHTSRCVRRDEEYFFSSARTTSAPCLFSAPHPFLPRPSISYIPARAPILESSQGQRVHRLLMITHVLAMRAAGSLHAHAAGQRPALHQAIRNPRSKGGRGVQANEKPNRKPM